MKKKILIVLGIVIFIVILVASAPFIYMLVLVYTQESPAKPQIEDGEFDYT